MLSKETEDRLEYVIKHDPIAYIAKKDGLIFYKVFSIKGHPVSAGMLKGDAERMCETFNAIYSLGYSLGVSATLKSLV